MAQTPVVFEDFDSNAPARWVYVQDGVMGGVSQGSARLTTEDGDAAVHLYGQVSTANNGGFIQIRQRFDTPWPDTAKGLRLSVKGNGERYYIFLRVPNMARRWYSYRQSFVTTSDWAEVSLPFEAFAASHFGMPPSFAPQDVISLGIVAYGKDFDADVTIRKIELY